MSLRGLVLLLLGAMYGIGAGSVAAVVATMMADRVASPFDPGSSVLEAMVVFLLVAALLGGAAVLPAARLMRAFLGWWDARWDEEGERQ